MTYFWSFIERMGAQVLRVLFIIVFARLLTPQEFAIMGLVSSFLAIGEVAIRSGLGVAIIREQQITEKDKSSLFWFCGIASVLLAAAFSMCASFVPLQYGNFGLRGLVSLMSLGLIFNAIAVVPTALLMRENRFDTLAKCTLIAQGLPGIVAIILALNGAGVWSLVVQQLGGSILSACLTTALYGWVPKSPPSLVSLRRMLPITMTHLATNICDTLVTAFYYGVLAKSITSLQVGFYNRTKVLQETPVSLAYQIIARPSLAEFSRTQADLSKLRILFLTARNSLCAVTLPMMILLSANSYEIARVVLGSHWIGMAPYLRSAALVGCFFPLYRIAYNLMSAIGSSSGCIAQELVKSFLLLGSLFLLIPFGLQAVMYGQALVAAITFVHSCWLVQKFIGLRMAEQIKALIRYFVAGGAMTTGILGVRAFCIDTSIATMLLSSFVGTSVYLIIGLCWQLDGICKPLAWIRSKMQESM